MASFFFFNQVVSSDLSLSRFANHCHSYYSVFSRYQKSGFVTSLVYKPVKPQNLKEKSWKQVLSLRGVLQFTKTNKTFHMEAQSKINSKRHTRRQARAHAHTHTNTGECFSFTQIIDSRATTMIYRDTQKYMKYEEFFKIGFN